MQKQRQPLPKRSRIPVRQVEELVTDGKNFYLASDRNSEYPLTVVQRLTDDPSNWTFQDQDNRTYTPRRNTNTGEIKQTPEKKYSGLSGLVAKAWDTASNWSNTVDVNNLFHPVAQTIRETNEGKNPVVNTAQFFDPTGISHIVPKVVYNMGINNVGVGDAADIGLLAAGPTAFKLKGLRILPETGKFIERNATNISHIPGKGSISKIEIIGNRPIAVAREPVSPTKQAERIAEINARNAAKNNIDESTVNFTMGNEAKQSGRLSESEDSRNFWYDTTVSQDKLIKQQDDKIAQLEEKLEESRKQIPKQQENKGFSWNPFKRKSKPSNESTPTDTPPVDTEKPKLPKRSQFGFKQVGKHIGKTYKVLGMGTAYAAGVSPLVGAGYGIYQWSKPTPTAADSLVNQYKQQIPELEKLQQAVSLKQYTDSLKRSLANPSNQSIKSDTLITDRIAPEGYKESSQNNRSSDVNSKATAADL